MNRKVLTMAVTSSLALGLGMGLGVGLSISVSSKPFIFEANNTPIGSFMFKGNLSNIDTLPEGVSKEQIMLWNQHTA